MPLRISLEEEQGWLESTKLQITDVDAALQDAAVDLVFSALGSLYDTSLWLDPLSTPSLVRKIIAMLVAAWVYDRQYSEDAAGQDQYADKLEKRAMMLLDGLTSGLLTLTDIDPVLSDPTSPEFYPNDATGSAYIYDGLGVIVGNAAGSEDIKFRMGAIF